MRVAIFLRWNRVLPQAIVIEGLNAYLQSLAVVTRELGRFPTNAELRPRRRQDPRFPSSNVFGRLGNKRQLVSRLTSFSESHDGLDDVRAICLATTVVATKADEPDEEAERRVRDLVPTGVVY